MDFRQSCAVVLVLFVGVVCSQECSSFSDQATCCGEAACSFCQTNITTQVCLNSSQAEPGACPLNLCTASGNDTSTDAPTTTTTDAPTPTTNTSATTTTTQDPTPTTNNVTDTTTTAATSTTPKGTTTTTTTEVPTTHNSTTTEPPTMAPLHPGCGGQRFDAASFVGGMILCGGVIAIIFFGCKFYKSKTERKYQQF